MTGLLSLVEVSFIFRNTVIQLEPYTVFWKVREIFFHCYSCNARCGSCLTDAKHTIMTTTGEKLQVRTLQISVIPRWMFSFKKSRGTQLTHFLVKEENLNLLVYIFPLVLRHPYYVFLEFPPVHDI